jgi:lysophospholipid acyltransferase (LPLAT)-like uncharacterized protein
MMTGAVVLPVVVVPTRRWILGRTWDRTQIREPFCSINMHFAPPIEPGGFDLAESLATNVRSHLDASEATHDPLEAAGTGEHELNTGAAM